VLEVMWFHSMKVRDVEVMWVERFVMEVFQVDMSNSIPTLEVKEVYKQLRLVCHFVFLSIWVRDEEEMLTLSLRMEVDSVHSCLITKEFEVTSNWRLFHSIYWLHIQSIQDVEVLSMCRLDSICHSILVSIALSQWYMFEFDCVMLWLNSSSHFVSIHSIWTCEDVSVLRLSLEFHFRLNRPRIWEWVLNSLKFHIVQYFLQNFSVLCLRIEFNENETINAQFINKKRNIHVRGE
jgi:hypothetical protein